MLAVEIRRVPLRDSLVVPLLAGLEEEYRNRYGRNDEMMRTVADEFDPPSGCFVVVVDDDITVAGGGFRCHSEGTCEIKRMWTNPAYRRRGLAARVLAELEEAASAAGYTRLVLETGPLQPEASALYERRGYQRIPPYGPYPRALAYATDLGPAAWAAPGSRPEGGSERLEPSVRKIVLDN